MHRVTLSGISAFTDFTDTVVSYRAYVTSFPMVLFQHQKYHYSINSEDFFWSVSEPGEEPLDLQASSGMAPQLTSTRSAEHCEFPVVLRGKNCIILHLESWLMSEFLFIGHF